MTDRSSYEKLWDDGILPQFHEYRDKIAGISIKSDSKEIIWNEYNFFNKKCKSNYMAEGCERLDRHKVCACYMYAIVKAHCISSTMLKETENQFSIINETIAINIGFSLLRAFIIENAETNKNLTANERSKIISGVQNGIRIPECNHGEYISNFATELHYTYIENNYNILSLSNTLFLLEQHSVDYEVVKRRKRKTK